MSARASGARRTMTGVNAIERRPLERTGRAARGAAVGDEGSEGRVLRKSTRDAVR